MTTTYRIVHYVSDPFLGSRVPVGALLERGDWRAFVEATALPGAQCLGDGAWLLSSIIESLRQAPKADDLCRILGLHIACDPPCVVPAFAEASAEDWLLGLLAPPTFLEKKGAPLVGSAPHRSTRGLQLLETLQVDKVVRRKFDPKVRFAERADLHFLPTVSQWVASEVDTRLLLMEPIAIGYGYEDGGVDQVVKLFGEYAYMSKHEDLPTVLCAYLLPTQREVERTEATNELRRVCQVLDAGDVMGRQYLRKTIIDHAPASFRQLSQATA